MQNNRLKFPLIICSLLLFSACSVKKDLINTKTKYLTLVYDRLDRNKSHIELRNAEKIVLDSSEFFIPQDDREIMARLNYTKTDRIAILKEYFNFQGNKQLSNKQYAFHIGTSANRVKMTKEKIPLTIQVEALYAISIMLLDYNVSISPALVNTETGMICNENQQEIDEIFKIYRKWLKATEKNEFTIITWPLAHSKYEWLNRKDVKIKVLPSL